MSESDKEPTIKFATTSADAKHPTRSHTDDAGFDLHAAESAFIHQRHITIIDTGVQAAIPKGYVGLVCPRSGLAAKYGVTVVNAPGIIDSGYRDTIKVILSSKIGHEIIVGDRIAQLVVVPILISSLNSPYLEDDTDRGKGGLGSTDE